VNLMTTESNAQQTDNKDELSRIAAYLIRTCGLTEADFLKVIDAQRRSGAGFVDTVLALKLATPADIDAARSVSYAIKALPEARASAELTSVSDPFSPHAEGIRSLRTALLLQLERLPRDEGFINVVAVCSAQKGEGRSRLAAELAISLAQLDAPTLLIDADLRTPRQHRLFDVPEASGLAEALTQSGPAQVLNVDGLPNLSLLTAGQDRRKPLERVSQAEFRQLMQGYARRFRHVIIDTPAIAPYPDALAVTAAVRNVLLVMRRHHCRLAAAQAALARLQAANGRIVGSVLQDFQAPRSRRPRWR
tara:strand:- start:30584 stop:31501 length:918 start_codon:yes stop_codon:yes gene_type:complete